MVISMNIVSNKEQRKRLFINRKVQGKIIWRCVVFCTIYHLLMIHTLFAFEFMAYLVGVMNGDTVQTFPQIYMNFLGKYYPIIFTALAVLPVLVWDVLKMSHRIVGPLIPFQRAINKLRNGEVVEEVKLRKNDMLDDFQDDFNEFLRWYKAERTELAERDRRYHEEIDQIEEKILSEMKMLQDAANGHELKLSHHAEEIEEDEAVVPADNKSLDS